MEKNPDYYGTPAYLDKVTFKISADTDAAFIADIVERLLRIVQKQPLHQIRRPDRNIIIFRQLACLLARQIRENIYSAGQKFIV